MRSISLATGVAFAMATSMTFAHAQSAAAPTMYSAESTQIGVLLADPAAKAVLAKYIPAIVSNDGIQQAASMTLKDIEPMAQGAITDQNLADIDKDLAKLPVKK
jgi:hypothetical protein